MKIKKKTITEILKSKTYTDVEKKIAWEKWRFNQMPDFYRQDNKEQIFNKINAMRI